MSSLPDSSSSSIAGDTHATEFPWRAVCAGWLLLTLVTLPAVQLTGPAAGSTTLDSLARSMLFLLGIYSPWLLVTPGLWQLCARWPLGMGSDAKAASKLLAVGICIIPALSLVGWVFGYHLSQLALPRTLPDNWLHAVIATSLFALPTYVAVIGIGQAMAYIRRYRRRGELLAQAREQALRARLNHHFLFNALNAIGALGYRDAERADAALAQLGELLRNLLQSEPFITLREEAAQTMAFIELQRLLQQQPVQVQLQASADAWEARVPSLLLQPLIENAVRFASSSDADEATISLQFESRDDLLHLQIRNPLGDAAA
ncbi:MAG: sensor histidine kinase, partial [Stenotrophomonas sp.]